MDRRTFLKKTSGAAAGAAVAGLVPELTQEAAAQAAGSVPGIKVAAPANPGKLVRVTYPGTVKGGKIKSRKILNGDMARTMVHRALTEFTGQPDAVKALGQFIKADDVVGLKVNCLGSPGASSHPDITYAVADLCQKLGVTEDRIIIYDQYGSRMQRGGYKLTDKKGKIRVIRHWGRSPGRQDPKWGYGPMTDTPAGPTRFAKILDMVTAIIAFPVPKDHDFTGVTGAMKNMAFGNIEVVPKFHCNKGYGWIDGKKSRKKGTCQPVCKWGACSVARMYAAPQITSKIRLHIADATSVLFHGGPQYQARWTKAYDSVIIATDPVALDALFLKIVDEHRAAKKMVPINEIKRPRRRPAVHIAHAEAMGLGIADPAKWDYREVTIS
jgi:uncharacterized protein (DUF362 family)